jgi:two-component system KDP operon response regulator KdpE
MSGARVLIVDDEDQLRRAIRLSLQGQGFEVREAHAGADGLIAFDNFKPDVMLLDLMLPDMSGVDVCRQIRQRYQTPIIVLSVIGSERTKVQALNEGADDYVTKPFGMNELVARIRVALRRGAALPVQSTQIKVGGLVIDVESRAVTIEGEEIHLTPTEYSLLKYLAINAGRVLTHPMILRAVWGNDYAEDTHILRTYINQLRSKLHDDRRGARYIRTDPGIGYRLVDPSS